MCRHPARLFWAYLTPALLSPLLLSATYAAGDSAGVGLEFDSHFVGVYGRCTYYSVIPPSMSGRECLDLVMCALHLFAGHRWPGLRRSLEAPTQHVCWLNPFTKNSTEWEPPAEGWKRIVHLKSNTTFFVNRPTKNSQSLSAKICVSNTCPPPVPIGRLMSHYLLDGASPLPGE
jgi:hypothetical protein